MPDYTQDPDGLRYLIYIHRPVSEYGVLHCHECRKPIADGANYAFMPVETSTMNGRCMVREPFHPACWEAQEREEAEDKGEKREIA